MSDSAKKLGENIRKVRLAKGMTQGDLCRKLDVDRAYVSNMESGKKNPTLMTIERICIGQCEQARVSRTRFGLGE